jgi:hypothetical protein
MSGLPFGPVTSALESFGLTYSKSAMYASMKALPFNLLSSVRNLFIPPSVISLAKDSKIKVFLFFDPFFFPELAGRFDPFLNADFGGFLFIGINRHHSDTEDSCGLGICGFAYVMFPLFQFRLKLS